MKLFYISNIVYQYVYSEPIYRQLGGTFLTWTRNTRLKIYHQFTFGNWRKFPNIVVPRILPVKQDYIDGFSGLMIANGFHPLNFNHDKLKLVLMYHGTSDKIPLASKEAVNQFDYYFINGAKNENKILKAGGINPGSERLVRVGNWMFDRVQNNKHNTSRIKRRFGLTDVDTPVILYAPTWKYGGGTLLQNFEYFVNTIPKEYNLIIRPHSADLGKIRQLSHLIPRKYRRRVKFAHPSYIFTHHYIDNLMIADLLLSDTSSMLYEYLIMKRPIIVCDTDTSEVAKHDDGMSVPHQVDHYSPGDDIMSLINKNLHSKSISDQMNDLLHKCFYFNDGKSTKRCIQFIKRLNSG